MNTLAGRAGVGYYLGVPATAGIWVDSQSTARRAAPDRCYFFARSNHLNGGLRREAEKPAGVLTGRSVNPTQSVTPLFDSSSGGLQSQLGVRIMNPAYRRALRLSRRIPNAGPCRAKAVHIWSVALVSALRGLRS